MTEEHLINMINSCREERDIGKKYHLLHYINKLLPVELRTEIPSIITHDCIDAILSSLEAKFSPPIYELKRKSVCVK